MPRWLVWSPVWGLLGLTAVLGWREGRAFVTMTEGDVIAAYAQRYVAQAGPGARPSDCTAEPGDAAWLVIRCGRGPVTEYHVSRFGWLKRITGPAGRDILEGPKT